MMRRSNARPAALLGAALGAALTATLLAGCGGSKPTPSAVATAATPSGVPSASTAAPATVTTAPIPSPTAQPTLALQHVDAALEDKLPATINGVALFKTSLMLSGYVSSDPAGGDKTLYAPWLVKFGKTPSDVHIAVAFSLTDQVTFQARAISVPGVGAAALSNGFADAARAAGWPVTAEPNLMLTGVNAWEIIDPAVKAAGGTGAGYVYARDGLLYEVITDDQSLLLAGLVRLEAIRQQPSATP
jgi:hypothetical protein